MNLAFIYYGLVLILAVVALWRLFVVTKNQRSPHFVGLFTLLVVVSGAYMILTTSQTAEEALLATKITYLDGTFVIFFLLLGMCQVCNIKASKWLFAPMFLVNIEILTVVFMAGHNKLHYVSYALQKSNGASFLTKEYGPHHTIYMIYLVLGMIIPIGLVIYAAVKNTASWIYISLLAAGEGLSIVLYLIQHALHLSVDLVPLGYILTEYLILYILDRTALYDAASNVQLSIVRSNDLGFAIVNNNFNFISADEVACRFFPEFKGLKIDRKIDNDFLCTEFESWIYESKDHPVKAKYYIRDNVDIKAVVSPLYDNSGKKQIGYLLQVSDDTQNQDYIRELKALNERANEMAQTAKRANNAKSDFLSNMSHEIRTPMNAVLGMNEMIMRECDDPQIREYSANIENSGKMLLSIINDILDFSKIEAGKMDIIPVDYDLSTIINDIVNMNRPRAEAKNLKFEVKADENLPKYLNGDSIRIKQVITNLVNNAIKYTNEGSVTVEIKGEISLTNTLGMYIGVKDTGKGIKEEDQNKLFKSFQRIDEKNNRNVEGTGLGLAITEGFVRLMGGQIGVKSEYGHGSLFYVTIPQKIVKEGKLGDYRVNNKKDTTINYKESFKAKDAKVLIVDDTNVNIVVFKGLLKKTQISIDTASSGIEALDLCKDNKYDIIFLDHMMPEMDGMEVLKQLQLPVYDINSKTPKIALTANAVAGSKDMYIEAGFSDYLSKPMNPEQLEKMVIKYLPSDKLISE